MQLKQKNLSKFWNFKTKILKIRDGQNRLSQIAQNRQKRYMWERDASDFYADQSAGIFGEVLGVIFQPDSFVS